MMDAIKNGNEQAFEEMYLLYREKLFAYFFKKTNSKEDAKDLLQIVFLKLWQYRSSISSDYSPEQQLFYIARTVFIDYLRKENKLQKIKISAGQQSDIYSATEHLDEFDIHARLQTKLSRMPLLRKRVFQLHKIEGYSYKEIAEMLSIPVKSVDNNLIKALKYLRNTGLIFIIIVTNIFR